MGRYIVKNLQEQTTAVFNKDILTGLNELQALSVKIQTAQSCQTSVQESNEKRDLLEQTLESGEKALNSVIPLISKTIENNKNRTLSSMDAAFQTFIKDNLKLDIHGNQRLPTPTQTHLETYFTEDGLNKQLDSIHKSLALQDHFFDNRWIDYNDPERNSLAPIT